MKNPFKLSGFDSIIAKGLTLRAATVIIGVGQTLVVHLVIEDGAVVLGKMAHLDHISAGEQV